MKLSTIFMISFFVIGLLGTLSLVGYSSYVHNTHLINMAYKNLDVVANLEGRYIDLFLEEQKEKILLVADADFDSDALKGVDKNLSEDLREELNSELEEMLELNDDFHELFILNKQGIVVASTNSEFIGQNKLDRDYFIYGKEKVYLDTKDYQEDTKHSILTISAPIMGKEHKTYIGIVVAVILINDVVDPLSVSLGVGETEEIYLVNEEGFLITPSKFLSGQNKGVLTQVVDTENARECVEDLKEFYISETKEIGEHEEDVVVFKNYRGEEVFGLHSYVLETKWCILVEVEKQEVLDKPIKEFVKNSILISLIVILILTLTGFSIGKYFDKKYKLKGDKR